MGLSMFNRFFIMIYGVLMVASCSVFYIDDFGAIAVVPRHLVRTPLRA